MNSTLDKSLPVPKLRPFKDKCTKTTNESEYDYTIKLHETLQSKSALYEVLEYLGKGTFGQVVKCWEKGSNRLVAVKITKDHPNYRRQAEHEIQILHKLMISIPNYDTSCLVKALDVFNHFGHTCIVFEMLQQNLYDYLKSTDFKPSPLSFIRPVIHQVFSAISKLWHLGIVHSDIKPENIMLIDNYMFPMRVKLIDYGSATTSNQFSANVYLQSRYYRAPEVMIGHYFNEKIDIWSIGCVAAELFLGWPLYPGPTEYDQIRYITDIQGEIPQKFIHKSDPSRRNKYFKYNNIFKYWKLKTLEEYDLDYSTTTEHEVNRYRLSSLDELMNIHQTVDTKNDNSFMWYDSYISEKIDRDVFINLVKFALNIDYTKRLSAEDALKHPFFTFTHLINYMHVQRVKESVYNMEIVGARKVSQNVSSFSYRSSIGNNNNLSDSFYHNSLSYSYGNCDAYPTPFYSPYQTNKHMMNEINNNCKYSNKKLIKNENKEAEYPINFVHNYSYNTMNNPSIESHKICNSNYRFDQSIWSFPSLQYKNHASFDSHFMVPPATNNNSYDDCVINGSCINNYNRADNDGWQSYSKNYLDISSQYICENDSSDHLNFYEPSNTNNNYNLQKYSPIFEQWNTDINKDYN